MTEDEVKEEVMEDLVYIKMKKVATKKVSKKNIKGAKRTLNTRKQLKMTMKKRKTLTNLSEM